MPEHHRPTPFTDLPLFLARCIQAIAQDGPAALVVCGRHRPTSRRTLRLGIDGPPMTVIGWDAVAQLTLCEVSAQAALDAAAQGRLVDRPLPQEARS
jgi:hypothetical protein